MTTLAELQQRLTTITNDKLPTLKAEQQTLERRRQEAEAQLKELGWDGKNDLDTWLGTIADTRDQKLQEAEQALKETEDAIASVESATA